MKVNVFKSNEGGYITTNKKNAEFLFKVELGQIWYSVILHGTIGELVLDYDANPDDWEYDDLIYAACGYINHEEELCRKFECVLYECEVEEDKDGRYKIVRHPIRTAKVGYNQEW